MAALTDAQAAMIRWARVARMATIGASGRLHNVPICPALDGDRIVICLESGSTKARNALADGRVAIIFDDYIEDWDANRGVLVQGRAAAMEGEGWERGRRLLYEKFQQYEPRAEIGPGDPIVEVAIKHIASWGL